MSLKVQNINHSFFNDDDNTVWNSLLKKTNWQQKIKIFRKLIKKIVTDIQPKFTFQLGSFVYDPKLLFFLYLSHKPPKYLEWSFCWAYKKYGNTEQISEILWTGYWLPTEWKMPNRLFRLGAIRAKISKTTGSWRFEDTFKLREKAGRSPVVHSPSRKPSPTVAVLGEGQQNHRFILVGKDLQDYWIQL